MTPKEKAEELVNRFENETHSLVKDEDAKQCALIAVDEIIKEELLWLQEVGGNESESEWIKVKQEINNL